MTPEQSKDLAQRMKNLGARLDVDARIEIMARAAKDDYEGAMELLPDIGNKGAELVVTIETAAWVLTEVMAGELSYDAALKVLRDAAEEGL